MSAIKSDHPVTVKVGNRNAMELELDKAVADLRERAAAARRCGILVTRHGPDEFTVALSESVPFGLTVEKHDW